MATEKLEFSLRLHHATADLTTVTKDLGLAVEAGWDKGEQKRTLQGAARGGTRDQSYRSFKLAVVQDTDLSDALGACLKMLVPFGSVLQSFVSSGGTGSLAIGWFCNSTVEGGRVPASVITELGQLKLTLDFYLYMGGGAPADPQV